MGDKTKIQWSDATLFGEYLPRRCRVCRQVKEVREFNVDNSRNDGHGYVCRSCRAVNNTGVPNSRERHAKRLLGQAWCRNCNDWLPLVDMSKNGLCRAHQREADRERYANDAAHRERRRAHASERKRGVERVPAEAKEMLLELFDGGCAYCDQSADTWDHVVPVSKGGKTVPGNILPSCVVCNSSKRARDMEKWLTSTGRYLRPYAVEYLTMFQVL